MALSLLSQPQHLSFLELQTIFEPFSFQQNPTTKIDISNCNDNYQMEFNSLNHYQGLHLNNNSSTNSSSNSSEGCINSSTSNNAITANNRINSNSAQNIAQNNTTRNYMNGSFHQHLGTSYEQALNFVDSPPNSEHSWTDEQSKGSPGPQIIDVQIYSNSGSRKRRMDWDSLDISQTGNTETVQSAETPNKIIQQEKDKHKREKLTGRGNWTDDIGFDLNAEFNSNTYLNNEPFLSFSPTLTTLKQEPQADPLKIPKGSSNALPTVSVTKLEKSASLNILERVVTEKPKNDLNGTFCGCGSPQSSQQGFDNSAAAAAEKIGNNAIQQDNAGSLSADKGNSLNTAVGPQVTVVDASKIENLASKTSATAQSDDHKFQYILAAATSIATKSNEETLTYLNQGQSYEIKLKKTGDLSFYRDKILKSVIKICFHERRLQFMEREQMQQWQAARPGERIIEVDVPLSYGLCHVSQPLNPNYLNVVEIFWDPLKEVGVYIKVNCISTEFTPKKHGGEKGVPFRLQIETYIETTNTSLAAGPSAASQSPLAGASSPGTPGNLTPTNHISNYNATQLVGGKQPVHAAACQIKVFKLKGADRKHKQDREKIQKRPQSEQDKFQPSYECTIMNDIPVDTITGGGGFSPEHMKFWPNSPVHIPKYDGILPFSTATTAVNSSPIAINSVTSTNSPNLKLMDANMISPQQVPDPEDGAISVNPESNPNQVAQWLTHHRLTAYLSTFAHFSGSDIMRMSKEDLIQICGLADGIRMFNILRAKAITPRLTIYVSLDGSSFNAVYLVYNTAKELTQKLFKISGFYEMFANATNGGAMENGPMYGSWGGMHSKYSGSGSNIYSDASKSLIYLSGPSGVHVTITDEVLNNEIKDGQLFALDVQNGKVIMKMISKNDN